MEMQQALSKLKQDSSRSLTDHRFIWQYRIQQWRFSICIVGLLTTKNRARPEEQQNESAMITAMSSYSSVEFTEAELIEHLKN